MSDERFYGLYTGVCVDNKDPDKRSRIRLKVRQVLGDATTNWAEACLPVTTNETHINHIKTITTSSESSPDAHAHTVSVNLDHNPHVRVPRLKQTVWVMFIGGDPNFPVWIGVSK